MITLSVIKADTGGFVGHSAVHPDMMQAAEAQLKERKEQGIIIDYQVARVGDDIALIMTHRHGADSELVHRIAWETFQATTEVAKRLKLYGAGQDLLKDAFAGNVKGMGPGVAEMQFEERPSEPVIIFLGDKTSPGAWNLPVFRMFADPFNTPGLVIDPKMHDGFDFEIMDLRENKIARFRTPQESYDLLMFIGSPNRFVIRNVYLPGGTEPVASTSTQRLSLIAGKYVGKDDPVLIVRCQSGLPAVGEVLEAFTQPHLVEGWMRGSHCGPLMPVGFEQANTSRFDGPPRVVAYGFQVNRGRLVGPRDMFGDPGFDRARQTALEMAEMMRRMGPFEPHRLPLEEMEYTAMPQVMRKVQHRFQPADQDAGEAAGAR
ncbi:MAG: fructose 1,6-bisphosphatase [Firmicutes bacterium]|nr:fructose 1,6-bisphosphatase [Bacillota bacterium]